jgi:hypothetical protein
LYFSKILILQDQGFPDFDDVALDPDCEDMFDTQFSQSQPYRKKPEASQEPNVPPVVVTATIVPNEEEEEENIPVPSQNSPPSYLRNSSTICYTQPTNQATQQRSLSLRQGKRPNEIVSELSDEDDKPTTVNVQITLNIPKVCIEF